MALTRKLLKSMGIEDEKIEQIIEAHTETVDALKDERNKYKESADKLESVSKEFENAQTELNELKKNGEKDPFKVKYEAIKEEYENYKSEVNAKEVKNTKENVFRQILKKCNISEKRINSIIKVSDDIINSIDLDKDGNAKNEDTISQNVKTEWEDFIITTETQGAKTSNPPASNGKSGITKEEILNIKDTAERQKAIAENHELFNF